MWDNAHCFDFRKTAWCGTMPTVLISGRQSGVGQEVIHNPHCVDLRKAAWCGKVSGRQPGVGQFQEGSLVWDRQ